MLDVHPICERIREARVRNGWTQAQVAEWSGVSTGSWAQWEGGRVPGGDNLARIASGLRVSLDWLCGVVEHDAA